MRAAVIGCGRMGLSTPPHVLDNLPPCWLPLSHADSIESHPAYELVALSDPYLPAFEAASQRFPHIPVYKDPHTMLGEQDIDLVCIATRTPERFQLIKAALSFGIRHLHIEKPLCNSLIELDIISDLLASTRAHVTFGALRRYLAPYLLANSSVDQGLIGDLSEIQVALGTGRLCWSQIHAIDLISMYFSPKSISEVRCLASSDSYSNVGHRVDGDPLIKFIYLSDESGLQGIISTSSGCDLWLYGQHGILSVLNDGSNVRCRKPDDVESPYWTSEYDLPIPLTRFGGSASALDRHVCSDPVASVTDTQSLLYSQRLLFSCVESLLSNGAPVHPDHLSPDLSITGRIGNLYA